MLSILISVLSISISFLIVSKKLDVEAANRINSAGWKLYFDDISDAYLEGNASELQSPFIVNRSTSIRNFDVTFSDYNDSVSYIINVVNGGIIDSKISTISYEKPICYGKGVNGLKDAKMVCDNIEIEFTYVNGEKIKKGDILDSNSRRDLKLTIRYTGNKLPENTVEIRNLSMTIIYVQK